MSLLIGDALFICAIIFLINPELRFVGGMLMIASSIFIASHHLCFIEMAAKDIKKLYSDNIAANKAIGAVMAATMNKGDDLK